MTEPASEKAQRLQRVKVGMTGLAAVVLLIGIASMIFSALRQERPIAAAGAGSAGVVENLTVGNAAEAASNEPLADLGVAPGAQPTENAQ
jgi:hypothetical protein